MNGIQVSIFQQLIVWVSIRPPDVTSDGRERELTSVQVGDASLLWTTPQEALDWLDNAYTVVADTWALNKINRATLAAAIPAPVAS